MSDFFISEDEAQQARRDAFEPRAPANSGSPPLIDLGETWRAIERGVANTAGALGAAGELFANLPNTALETPSYLLPADPVQRAARRRLTDPNFGDQTALARHFSESRAFARGYVQRRTPDPATLSEAQRVLSGVVEGITPAILGGPVGFAGASGERTYNEMRESGVDEETAQGAAVQDFLTMGAAATLPAALPGRIWQRAVSGAVLNAGVGVAQRSSMSDYLEERGYPDLAANYKPWDQQSLAVDLGIGAIFGPLFGHSIGGARPAPRERISPETGETTERAPYTADEWFEDARAYANDAEPDFTEAYAQALIAKDLGHPEADGLLATIEDEASDADLAAGRARASEYAATHVADTLRDEGVLDAAMVQQDAIHREVQTAPGFPEDSAARRAHSQALRMAEEQAANDEPVDVSSLRVEEQAFVPREDIEAMALDVESARRTLADRPPTLTAWVRRQGGISDDRGDVAGAAGDHRVRAFSRMVRADGQPIDRLIEDAVAEGFFPAHTDGALPTRVEFIDALNEDAAGRINQTTDADTFAARNARQILDYYAAEGVDISLKGSALRDAVEAMQAQRLQDMLRQALEDNGFADRISELEAQQERARARGIDPDMLASFSSSRRRNTPLPTSEIIQMRDALVERGEPKHRIAGIIARHFDRDPPVIHTLLKKPPEELAARIEREANPKPERSATDYQAKTYARMLDIAEALAREQRDGRLPSGANRVIADKMGGYAIQSIDQLLWQMRAGLVGPELQARALALGTLPSGRAGDMKAMIAPLMDQGLSNAEILRRVNIARAQMPATEPMRPGTLSTHMSTIRKMRAEGNARYSVFNTGASEVQQLQTRAALELGTSWEALSKASLVEILPDWSAAPFKVPEALRGATALHYKGRSYFNAQNIDPARLTRLVLHEVGVHHGMEDMIGKRGMNAVFAQISRMADESHPMAVAAKHYAETYSSPKNAPEEAFAYMVEFAPDLPVVQSFLARVRQWLVRTFGSTFGLRLTVEDIRQLALTSLRRVAKQAERDAVEVAPIGEEVFASQRPDGGGYRALHEFLDGSQQSAWVQVGDYNVYLRKGSRNLSGGEASTLDVANINRVDGRGSHEVLPPAQRGASGNFRQVMSELERAAGERGFGGVYVENIQNKFLPDVLQRGGYVPDAEANAFNPRMPSLYRPLEPRPVVGSEGAPLRVYHGTNAEGFDVPTRARSRRGEGISVTTDRDTAGEYGSRVIDMDLAGNYPEISSPEMQAVQDRWVATRAKTGRSFEEELQASGYDGYRDGPNIFVSRDGLLKPALPIEGSEFPKFSFFNFGRARAEGYAGNDPSEAREWVGAREDGLPMDEASRLARAEAMGFDTSTPYFHGTNRDVQGGFRRSGSGAMGPGVYLAKHPATSEVYAGTPSRDGQIDFTRSNSGAGGNILPVFVRGRMARESNWAGAIDEVLRQRQFRKMRRTDSAVERAAIERLRAEGFAGISDVRNDWHVVFDPADVRSRFAAFDPKRSEENDLLASFASGKNPPDVLQDPALSPRFVNAFDETRARLRAEGIVAPGPLGEESAIGPQGSRAGGRDNQGSGRSEAEGNGPGRGNQSQGAGPIASRAQVERLLQSSGIRIERADPTKASHLFGGYTFSFDVPYDLEPAFARALGAEQGKRGSTIRFDLQEKGERAMVIRWASIDKDLRGTGAGGWLYRQAIEWALRNGYAVKSDTSVSEYAQRIYQSLERDGYVVERNPSAAVDPDDGALVGMNFKAVFTVRGGPDVALRDAAPSPRGDYQIDGPTLKERMADVIAQRKAEEDYAAKSPEEQALHDNPDMKLSVGSGRDVRASALMDNAKAEKKAANDMRQGMEAAARCGARHAAQEGARRISAIALGGYTARAGATAAAGQALGLTTSIPVGIFAAPMLARTSAQYRWAEMQTREDRMVASAAEHSRRAASAGRAARRAGQARGRLAGLDDPTNFVPLEGVPLNDAIYTRRPEAPAPEAPVPAPISVTKEEQTQQDAAIASGDFIPLDQGAPPEFAAEPGQQPYGKVPPAPAGFKVDE